MIFDLFIVFTGSVLVSALLTRCVRDLARKRGWVDPPDVARHLHGKAVPRLGGVAIFLTVAGMATLGLLTRHGWDVQGGSSWSKALMILVPAALVFLVGLCDDFRNLGPYVKFGVQILAACLLYFGGFGIHRFDLLSPNSELGVFVGLALTIVWVLLITNAFNLIDGLDGLAGGSALFSTVVVFVSSLLTGAGLVTVVAAALAGAIVGFLRFNFNPATIFLGDSGSLFIGFLLSALALAGSQKASTMVAVAIPVVSLGLPILDVAIAVVRRFLSGKPLFQGDSEHIHHRLLKRGFRQRDAVLILYGVSALFALLSLALLHGGRTAALVLIVLGIGVFVGLPQLRYQEFKEMRRLLERTAGQKRIIANDLCVRRAAEALENCDSPSDLWRILADALQPSEFDGFRLKLPASVWPPLSVPPHARQSGQGELMFSWSALGVPGANWELKLELVDKDGEKCGSFSVFKRLNGKPLMMDINLLGDGFQVALAGAVRRTILDWRPRAAEYGAELIVESPKAISA